MLHKKHFVLLSLLSIAWPGEHRKHVGKPLKLEYVPDKQLLHEFLPVSF